MREKCFKKRGTRKILKDYGNMNYFDRHGDYTGLYLSKLTKLYTLNLYTSLLVNGMSVSYISKFI